MVPLAAAIRSMCDLGAQLTASWNQLYVGFWWGRKTGEPGEKPSKQRREPSSQTQPTYGVGSGNRTRATLVGGECSHHYAIPASRNNQSEITCPLEAALTNCDSSMFAPFLKFRTPHDHLTKNKKKEKNPENRKSFCFGYSFQTVRILELVNETPTA